MSRRVASLYFCFLISASFASAQSIENVQVVFTGQRVLISYDLNGKPDEKYRVQVYGSHNNFASPLRLVTGAVGEGVTAGKAKTIEWNIAEEVVTFKGQITFRLRGEVMAAALSLKSPAANSSIKTGKSTEIKWTGGNKNGSVRLELLQNGAVVKAINEGANGGAYAWNVPKDLAKGTYELKISSGGQTASSGPVTVKSPLPLWVKLSPIVVAGVIVVLLLPKDTPPPDPDLPNAPRPD